MTIEIVCPKERMFLETDTKGNRKVASRGDVLSVPGDVSQKTAILLINRGLAVAVEEKKEKAVKATTRKKAVKK